MDALPALIAVAAFVVAFISVLKVQQTNARAAGLREEADEARRLLEGTKKELSGAKEDLSKKSKALDALKSEAKKKARREGKKAQRDASKAGSEAPSEDESEQRAEIKKLKSAIRALEKQVADTQSEAEDTVSSATKAAEEAVASKLVSLESDKKQLTKTLEDLRASIKKQRESRPGVPGSQLNLKELAPEVVQELARYFRKGEEYERLYNVAQGQLQLSGDKLGELQKKYYAVCRELAVAVRAEPATDAEAKKVAEGVVATGDAASRKAKPAPSVSASASDDGEKKKRRRRRRKKKTDAQDDGAGSAAEGENAEASSASGAEHDAHQDKATEAKEVSGPKDKNPTTEATATPSEAPERGSEKEESANASSSSSPSEAQASAQETVSSAQEGADVVSENEAPRPKNTRLRNKAKAADPGGKESAADGGGGETPEALVAESQPAADASAKPTA